MPISSRYFVQSTTALLLVGFLALLGIVGMTFWLGERAQVYFNEVIAARDARSAAVDLRNAVQTAESSQRGFLFTGNEIYLASYGPAKALAERQLAAVNRLLVSYDGINASLAAIDRDHQRESSPRWTSPSQSNAIIAMRMRSRWPEPIAARR